MTDRSNDSPTITTISEVIPADPVFHRTLTVTTSGGEGLQSIIQRHEEAVLFYTQGRQPQRQHLLSAA